MGWDGGRGVAKPRGKKIQLRKGDARGTNVGHWGTGSSAAVKGGYTTQQSKHTQEWGTICVPTKPTESTS